MWWWGSHPTLMLLLLLLLLVEERCRVSRVSVAVAEWMLLTQRREQGYDVSLSLWLGAFNRLLLSLLLPREIGPFSPGVFVQQIEAPATPTVVADRQPLRENFA